MAENFDKFSISIDADVSALQSSLKAAQNTLAQFEGALKKATSIGEINYLNKNIDNLKGTIAQLNQQAGQLGKPMGDASQSLINFSRIAQDAPYGIMGVANNLNPMVESFQRLAQTEGGTKKALQAMIQGLAGPAGVGVAIGIVSSLAVTFSKEIAAFFKGPTAELEKFREELNKVAQEIYKVIGQEQTKRTKGILLVELITGGNKTQQEEALKQLKELYSKSDAIKKAKLGEDKAFYTTLVNQAAMQSGAVATEKNNAAQLDKLYTDQIQNEKKRNDELSKITGVTQGKTLKDFNKVISVDEQKAAINKKYNVLGNEIKGDIARLESDTLKQLAKITLVPSPDSIKNKGKEAIDAFEQYRKEQAYQLQKELLDIQKYQRLFKEIDLSPILTEGSKESIQNRKDKTTERNKKVTGQDNSIGKFLAEDAKRRGIAYDKEDEKVKGLAKSYENFATMLASNVTSGLMDVWSALEQGKNPLDAIGQIFVNIAKNIAAAVLQATIFEAILNAFPELKAIFAASGTLQKAFGYSGKQANGGITNGASFAMVGEAGPEAIMPLSKLSSMMSSTFNAGAMSGSSAGGSSQFVLRGQDLLLAVNRSQKASNIKGQSISLA